MSPMPALRRFQRALARGAAVLGLAGASSGRRFDTLVEAAGLLTLGSIVSAWWQLHTVNRPLLLAAPLVAVMACYPLIIRRPAGDIEIGFDSAVLVFLALLAPAPEALGIWAAGTILSQATNGKRRRAQLFNTGLCILNGSLAVLVMRAISPLDRTAPAELVAVAAGCAAYFVADLLITGVSVALEAGTPLSETLWDAGALLSLVIFVGLDSLGYLGAVVTRLQIWVLPLLAAPLITLLASVRAIDRANVAQQRLADLLDAAVSAQLSTTPDGIAQLVIRQAQRVVRAPRAALRLKPAGGGELGVALACGDGSRWLVAAPRVSGVPYSPDDRQALAALAAIATESLARVRLAGEMAHVARHDGLTGLPNRALFEDRIAHAMALRQRGDHPLAVLFCDLDGFKLINDRFGHPAGDQLLVAAAGRLRECLRPGDTVARFGGDEFAVLLEELVDDDAVEQVCSRIIGALCTPFDIAGQQLLVGASIGVAFYTGDEHADELVRNADMAMYRAKALGKGRFELFETAMHTELVERLVLETELAAALELGQLRLHYQPMIGLGTGDIDGFEALLRWEHPRLGLISPLDFVGIAEETGLITAIGEWVLDEAYANACRWSAATGRPLSIGVNVSGRQLRGRRLVDHVTRLIGTGHSDAQLVLEITESVLVGDDAQSLTTLHALRDLGVLLAIDDFGTGYSSIGYLRHMPVDLLKIDHTFVAGVTLGGRLAALVGAILALARSLDLVVVAEGIEDIGQVLALHAMGCDFGQGFLFSAPMPEHDVLAFMADGPLDVIRGAPPPPAARPALSA